MKLKECELTSVLIKHCVRFESTLTEGYSVPNQSITINCPSECNDLTVDRATATVDPPVTSGIYFAYTCTADNSISGTVLCFDGTVAKVDCPGKFFAK